MHAVKLVSMLSRIGFFFTYLYTVGSFLARFALKSYYQMLDVEPTCTTSDIKKAFRRKAKTSAT